MNSRSNSSLQNANGVVPVLLFFAAAAGVAAALFFYQRHAEQVRSGPQPRLLVPTGNPTYASTLKMQSDGLPSGPSGVFIQLDPPAVSSGSSSQQTFQLGAPQDRQALDTYLEGELKRLVPETPTAVSQKE